MKHNEGRLERMEELHNKKTWLFDNHVSLSQDTVNYSSILDDSVTRCKNVYPCEMLLSHDK
jgi:hypothetical protein